MGFTLLQQKTGFVLLSDKDRKRNKNFELVVDQSGLMHVRPRQRSGSYVFALIKVLVVLTILVMILSNAL